MNDFYLKFSPFKIIFYVQLSSSIMGICYTYVRGLRHLQLKGGKRRGPGMFQRNHDDFSIWTDLRGRGDISIWDASNSNYRHHS